MDWSRFFLCLKFYKPRSKNVVALIYDVVWGVPGVVLVRLGATKETVIDWTDAKVALYQGILAAIPDLAPPAVPLAARDMA